MPTLGEIAAYQESLTKGIPDGSKMLAQINTWGDIYKKKDEIEKGRRDLEADAFKKETDLATRIISNPAWDTGDVAGINKAIDSAEADARRQRIPIAADSPLARIRQRVNAGDIKGGYQEMNDLYRGQLSYGEKAGFVIPGRGVGANQGNQGGNQGGNQAPPAGSKGDVPPAEKQAPPQFTALRPKADITRPETLAETPQEKTNAANFAKSRESLGTQFGNSVATMSNLDNVVAESDKWIKQGELDKSNWFSDKFIKSYKAIAGHEPAGTQGGWGGQLKRNIVNKLGLDEEYQLQAKNLANVILTQKNTLGGTTNEGQHLLEQANGKVTLSPWVLKKIAEQAKADQVHINMKAEASSKFAERYGDREGQGFDRLWNANADRKVFSAMNVYANPNLSDDEKGAQIEKLWGKKGSDEFNKNKLKYININLLRQNGTL